MKQTKEVEMAKPSIYDAEMEKSVLVTLMTSPQLIPEVNDVLNNECFYEASNREIYAAMMSLYNQGHMPDMLLVPKELRRLGSKLTTGDIMNMCMNARFTGELRHYALVLKDLSLRRKLWKIGYRLVSQASTEAVPLEEVQQEAKSCIDNLYEETAPEMTTLETSFKELLDLMIENMNMPEGQIRGTRTGFPEIDTAGGLCGGDLIVIGAESSQGKTSFATALAASAIEHGEGVAFYSLEMTSMQLTARIASMKSGISATSILNRKLTSEEVYQIDDSIRGINSDKMYFDERSTSSLDSLLTSIRSMKMRHDIKGVVVDYLQLIDCKSRDMNVEQATAVCARSLKNIAKELGIWVIALSQLNRSETNTVPSMARLRNSGQIAEAADAIYLIYRPRLAGVNYPEPFSDVTTDGTAMIICDKNRMGKTGQFMCGFRADNTLFYSLSGLELAKLRNGQHTSSSSNVTDFTGDIPLRGCR